MMVLPALEMLQLHKGHFEMMVLPALEMLQLHFLLSLEFKKEFSLKGDHQSEGFQLSSSVVL